VELAGVRLQSERRYRHLAEAIPHVVWTADAAGQIEYFNRRWFELTGMDEAQSLGSGWRAAIPPPDGDAVAERWATGCVNRVAFQAEFRVRRADGSTIWMRDRALPERDEAGRVVRWVGTLSDIDAERRAHDELETAVHLR